MGNVEAALSSFSEAIRLDLSLLSAYAARAELYQALGKNEQAVTDYSTILSVDPSRADIWRERGNTQVALGHAREGLADFNEALRLNPKFTLAYYNRAILFFRIGPNSRRRFQHSDLNRS